MLYYRALVANNTTKDNPVDLGVPGIRDECDLQGGLLGQIWGGCGTYVAFSSMEVKAASAQALQLRALYCFSVKAT